MSASQRQAEDDRAGALQRQAQARLMALRGELEGARRRNEELLAELNYERVLMASLQAKVASLQAKLADWETQAVEADRKNLHLSSALDQVTESTIWKASWPIRRLGARVPVRHRQRARRWSASIWYLINRKVPQQETEQPALIPERAPDPIPASPSESVGSEPAAAMLPSARLRQLDPAWTEPQRRPEWARLRSATPAGRIAVVLHLFYRELWPEMSATLLNNTESFDLYVTLVRGESEDIAPLIRLEYPDASILIVDNHGRDILPFLELARCGVLFKYELICKLHGKRSSWRQDGQEWRQHLIRGIIGSQETVQRILQAFASDPDLGMVVADGQMFGGRQSWVSNEARLTGLFGAIGLDQSSFEKSFVGGSIFWIRPFLMRTINALSLSYDDFEPEPIPSDGTMAHAVERLVTLVCHDAGMRVAQSGQILASRLPRAVDPTRVLLIAHYRPQIDAENRGGLDNGTAEWTAVANAAPMFPNHRQPRLPADLGFYDLRLPEVRRAQADLARRYGITALSYQLLWFSGRRRQERSPAELLASAIPDFPFMVCWANDVESGDREGFSEAAQDYPPEWERRFAHDVAVLMRDQRYLRLNGRPVLAIQRVEDIPGPVHAMRRLRAALRKNGFPQVHLIGGWTQSGANEPSPAQDLYLDSYVEWPPCNLTAQLLNPHEKPSGSLASVYDYSAVVEAKLDELAAGSDARRYRAVMTGWDDTARQGREGSVFHGATPTNFRRWLRAAVERSRAEATDRETLVFINAWNDWANGAYLEPDRDFGHGWLEAVALAADQRAIAEYELWGSPS